jgi:DNA-binding response OmpR family regulator
MGTTVTRFKNIWLCDDDEDDHHVFEEALKEAVPQITVGHYYTCLDLLNGLNLTRPDLLFLDINLPLFDGKECLRHIRERKELQNLPVIILSGSSFPADIKATYDLGATLYIVKPSSFQDLVKLLGSVVCLDWGNADDITNSHFVGGKFVPFSAGLTDCDLPKP